MPGLVDSLIRFGRVLRVRGLNVHVGRLLDLTEALQHVNIGSRDEVYHTCRALLVHRHEDLAIFDAAFEAFWREHGPDAPGVEPAPRTAEHAAPQAMASAAARDA